MTHKKTFFERLTGSSKVDKINIDEMLSSDDTNGNWMENDNEEGQLTVDVYQTADDIIIKAIVAGVKKDDLDISITQDMITIKGSRQDSHKTSKENVFCQELYWGAFSRSVLLPQEIDVNKSEAVLKDGLLTIHLPKLDKNRVQKVKVKAD
jgi:HSP20 family protein